MVFGNQERNPLERERVGIQDAGSFDELFDLLETLAEMEGGIHGTQKTYSPQELRKQIDRVRNGHRSINSITRSYGIRDKVEELLQDDRVYKKRVLENE